MATVGFEYIAAQLEATFNPKDASALAAMYAEDATLMPPNQPAVIGHASICAWFEATLPRVGTVRIAPTRKSVFERAGRGWQIQCDIWNGDQASR